MSKNSPEFCPECGSTNITYSDDFDEYLCRNCESMWDDDYYSDEEPLDLGACCACGKTEKVENILTINKRAPIPGTGWSCVVCGLPYDGAVTVMCDDCVVGNKEPKEVCYGYVKDKKRISYTALSEEEFNHNFQHE
ncbi:hypothetical protein OGM63_16610 [Plectonema radiosum NIES-515]|uniref:TFIIB-type domain-containing protein n=1 Tax=Plectonema radiosum NIES-515 TaxID=2986073 RepID=A0ABT3B296_9CYAN|nr:TFIIB-type zinc ribbon-containing protein [Plectonema radiosum]MCV3215115.1 hypothetical protein [Plectonema radiosum NIES-515]